MKKIVKICTLLGAVTFLLASCATTKADGNQSSGAKVEKKADKKKKKSGKYDQDAFDSAFYAGDYDTCIKMLDSRKSDSILTHIDSYMLKYLKKDYLASGKEINQTQANMNNVTQGMTAAKTVEAALAGENSVEYYGSPYERLLTYSMKALNNLKAGSVSGAKGVMDDYTGNYKDVVSALVQEQKKVNAMSYSDKIDSANAN